MRTTIRLEDRLLAEAKSLAAQTGRTLTAVIEDALRALFARHPPPGAGPVEIPTFGGEGAAGWVDLDDSAVLLDLMEQGDAPA